MGHRYGIWFVDMVTLGHLGCRYGIWANDMGDDRIDVVILRIDMGYPVTLRGEGRRGNSAW